MEISKGVPIPQINRSGPQLKYPFDQMQVGDSLTFKDVDKFQRARRAAKAYGTRHNMLFTSRKGVQDGERTGEGGTIWRVE